MNYFSRSFLIALGFVSAIALAAAGDRYFNNLNQDKDVVIQVNDAGATTTPLKVQGSTSQVLIGNGSVTEPAIGLQNSTTTGVYRAGANSLGFAANGVAVGNYNASGLWTFGASGGTQEHAINGKAKINNNVWEDYFVLTNTATNTNLFSIQNPSQMGCTSTFTYAGVLVGVSGRSGYYSNYVIGANTTPTVTTITNAGSACINNSVTGSGPWTVTYSYACGGPSNANSIEIHVRTQCASSTLGSGGYAATVYTRL